MKKLYLIFFILITKSLSAQTTKDFDSIKPLAKGAFNKMILQDITYAISGEAIPTNGIKVDVSKPEGTISGSFRPSNTSWITLITLDLKGGVTDKNFNFLQGFKNVNTAIEFRPSFHFSAGKNFAKFGLEPDATRKKILVAAKNHIVDQQFNALGDTVAVLNLLKEYHLAPVNSIQISDTGDLNNCSCRLNKALLDTISNKKIAIYFISKVLKIDDLKLDENSTAEEILGKWKIVKVRPSSKEILEDYNDEIVRLASSYKSKYKVDTKIDKQIQNASSIWTSKNYFWVTASPFIRAEKINAFHNKFGDQDSLYFKNGNSYYYGGNIYLNFYKVLPEKVAYLGRFIYSASRSNNIAALSPLNYETLTPIFTNGPSMTQQKITGSAYSYDKIKYGFMQSVGVELYALPLNTFVPGLFLSINANNSKLYNLTDMLNREKDMWLVGAEGGLIFNIKSREKDKEKSILSILAYIRHADLTDKKRTPISTGIQESVDDFRKRNISIGLKIGIPISLPQAGS